MPTWCVLHNHNILKQSEVLTFYSSELAQHSSVVAATHLHLGKYKTNKKMKLKAQSLLPAAEVARSTSPIDTNPFQLTSLGFPTCTLLEEKETQLWTDCEPLRFVDRVFYLQMRYKTLLR